MGTDTTAKAAVTVLGLGNLGRAVAAGLLRDGHPTTVWNRTPGRADALAAEGAAVAATVAEAVAASDLVIAVVVDHPALDAVLDAADGAFAGRVLVNVTSGSPDLARKAAARIAGQGGTYIDAAVLAVPETLGTPDATILFSGDPEAYAAHRDSLDLLGPGRHVGAAPETASVYDVAVLAGMYGMFGGFFQSVALAESSGIAAAEITDVLVTWLAGAAAVLPQFAREIDAGDYDTDVSTLNINQWGIAAILAAGKAQGVAFDSLTPLKDIIDRQVAEGHGGASLSRAIESIRAEAQ
ncbi:NAD(P)-dependent oxidoreductase [Nocardiopsis sediminis]|uniref:NAD(P)-dependent oxidoreductase n=1 Tax=Nocardiopsis sediminis TaxID=1778267 RepID=A0ABV8FJD7_9ACTN